MPKQEEWLEQLEQNGESLDALMSRLYDVRNHIIIALIQSRKAIMQHGDNERENRLLQSGLDCLDEVNRQLTACQALKETITSNLDEHRVAP